MNPDDLIELEEAALLEAGESSGDGDSDDPEKALARSDALQARCTGQLALLLSDPQEGPVCPHCQKVAQARPDPRPSYCTVYGKAATPEGGCKASIGNRAASLDYHDPHLHLACQWCGRNYLWRKPQLEPTLNDRKINRLLKLWHSPLS